ncbi:MAG: ribosome recycling factor [Legionellales bacterium]|mgnify:CR=1 FL=1|nr:ribosome recycling factor [Legionellales bacterium]|tara:strand:+ start:56625 stop:57182 length:558 start_codon:yes stop_codon:yes gene_type:complete
MLDEIFRESETRMQKSVEALHNELNKLRTGRAHTSLLDSVKVSYYGTDTPLSQVANVTVVDSRTLAVTPWDKSTVGAVEKAIMTSDLGLNPASHGEVIHVPLPPLTEERRKDLIKVVRAEGENAKVAVRNIRRDANTQIKELLKSKDISEDDERGGEERIQKITDKFVTEIDTMLKAKEADLMAI